MALDRKALINLIRPISDATYGTAGVDGFASGYESCDTFQEFWDEEADTDPDYNEIVGFNLLPYKGSPQTFAVLILQPRWGKLRAIEAPFPKTAEQRAQLASYVQRAIEYQGKKWGYLVPTEGSGDG